MAKHEFEIELKSPCISDEDAVEIMQCLDYELSDDDLESKFKALRMAIADILTALTRGSK